MDADTYDIVIDPVGGAATKAGFGVLRAGGRLVRVGNASQSPDVALSSMAHWIENKTTAGFNVGAWLAERPEEAQPHSGGLSRPRPGARYASI